jgi:glycosyltransferase involved in cell wall biosynthesis
LRLSLNWQSEKKLYLSKAFPQLGPLRKEFIQLQKKILILGPLPPTVGGITTFIEGILNSELNSKYELSTFDTQRPTYGLFKEVWDYTLLLRLGFLSLVKSLVWTFSHLMIFPIALLKNRPDIVHINTASYWVFWENGIYVLISKIFRRKVILHIHGGGFEDFYNRSNSFLKFLLQEILIFSNKVIVLSPSWQSLILDVVPSNKVSVVENFVDFASIHELKNEVSSKHILTVLFVGGPGAKLKGIFDVVNAASIVTQRYKDILFVLLACSGIKGLNALCEARGLASNIRILGYLYGAEKTKIFSESEIFLLPSYAEGLPITMLEAMAAGLPIIATSVGAIPDIIQDGKNGFLIKIGDYHTLAEKILVLANNQNLRSKMAKKNMELAQKNFEKSVILQKLGAEYDTLLDNP